MEVYRSQTKKEPAATVWGAYGTKHHLPSKSEKPFSWCCVVTKGDNSIMSA